MLGKKKKKMGIQREGEFVDVQLVKEVFTEQIQIRLKLESNILLGLSRKGQRLDNTGGMSQSKLVPWQNNLKNEDMLTYNN